MNVTNLSTSRNNTRLARTECALERMPHLATRIRALWGHAEFELYISRLLMESRDGNRQGLPWDAAQELLFLVELGIAKRALTAEELTGVPFAELFAQCLASISDAAQPGPGAADPWADPAAHKEAGHLGRGQSR
ncbi:MAG: hypothetical protein OEQ18_14490 [Gammaproteobacteria bacterium]|nr:hypothetical protein [Gammaproteobacteria bacterium]